MVVVVDGDEVAELQVTSHTRGLARHTLHSAAITEEHKSVVVNEVEAVLVELSSAMCLSNSKSDSVCETLAQRTSRDLNTGGVVSLRVTRGDTVDLTESLDVVEGERVAEEVEERILEHTSVAVTVSLLSV